MEPWLKGYVANGPTLVSWRRMLGWQTAEALDAQTDRWKVQA